MKQLILFFAITVMFASCQDPGTTIKSAGMDDKLLPEELKGLQVYRVYYDEGGASCLVAVLDNKINSTTYPKGKYHESLLLVQKENRTINCDQVLFENDSIITCRKNTN